MLENLTPKQLKFAQWYLAHKKMLRQLLVVFLVLLNVIIWGIAVNGFIVYFNTTQKHELMLNELAKERIDFIYFHKHFAPHDLVIDKQFLIKDDDVYDFIAIIENPNEKWRVSSFKYYFSFDNKETEKNNGFFLPYQKKYFFALSQDLEKLPSKYSVVFSEIKWKRVRTEHQWLLQILPKIEITEPALNYVVPEQKMISLPKFSFNVKNSSIYSFWQVDFTILLYHGNKISGINVFPVKQLMANKQIVVDFMWHSVPQFTEILVIPDINVFDSSVFMPNI